MTVTNTEKSRDSLAKGPETLRDYRKKITIGGLDDLSPEVEANWLELRRDFMAAHMNWDNPTDFDRYDADRATLQVLLLAESSSVIAGMRLTPGDHITKTLSWEMLEERPEGPLPVGDVQGVSSTRVWDLTRLVPGSDMVKMSSTEKKAVFTQLFGAGLAACEADGDQNPCWVFTTYQDFANAFGRYGLPFTPVPGTLRDGAQVYYAYPARIMAELADDKNRSAALVNAEIGAGLTGEPLLT